jgi:hypothetical protein
MLHFPNTAKKVPQNRPGYPDWAGKCSKLIPELIPELGPSSSFICPGTPFLALRANPGKFGIFASRTGFPDL